MATRSYRSRRRCDRRLRGLGHGLGGSRFTRFAVEALEARAAPSDSFAALLGVGLAAALPRHDELGDRGDGQLDQVLLGGLPARQESVATLAPAELPLALRARIENTPESSASVHDTLGASSQEQEPFDATRRPTRSPFAGLSEGLLDDLLALPFGTAVHSGDDPSAGPGGGGSSGSLADLALESMGSGHDSRSPVPEATGLGLTPPPRAHGAIRPLRFGQPGAGMRPSDGQSGDGAVVLLGDSGGGDSGGSGGNSPPVAVDDSFYTLHDQALSESAPGVLHNDWDPDGDPLTASLDTGPSHAVSFTLHANGSFEYVPEAGYVGLDSFTYYAHDGAEASEEAATVTIEVMNAAPIALDDSYYTLHDAAIEEYAPGVMHNDYDSDGDPITAVLDAGPAHAAAFTFDSDGGFYYEPQALWSGIDSFTYHVTDGIADSGVAEVTIEVMNAAPIALDDSYYTLHDAAIEEYAPGVMQNDYDSDGDPITAVLDSGPSHAAAFTFDSDGGFYYEPQALWAGTDSFTYHVTDELEDSNVATVTIEVMNAAPVAVDDPDPQSAYWTDVGTPLIVEAPGVRVNDWDPDGDAFTLVLDTAPSHGTLEYFNSDGSFKYVPSGTFAGTDSFTYYANDGLTNSDQPATVEIDVFRMNLTIHHGQYGADVLEAEEMTVGAFTVANWNDTDGDGVRDDQDNDGVIATAAGRDEIDLMELVIDKPTPDRGGWVTLTASYNVRLWNEETKVTEVVLDAYGNVELLTSQLPMTLYVEVTSPSTSLRDVIITADYQGYASDSVAATGIWSSLTAVEYGDATYADMIQQSPWSEVEAGKPPQPKMEEVGGTGLLPIPTTVEGSDFVCNAVWMCFTVTPPGIQDEAAVHFDLTRRIERKVWALDASKSVIEHGQNPLTVSFPEDDNEEANDDSSLGEDESDEPNDNGHMFTLDAPGPQATVPAVPGGIVYFVDRFNAEEFVRVGINLLFGGNGVAGSRCSGKYDWHVTHTLVDDGTGEFTRDATGRNEIGPGHISVDDYYPWDDT